MAQVYLPEHVDPQHHTKRGPIPSTTDQFHPTTSQRASPFLKRADAFVVAALVGIIALIIAGAGRAEQHTQSVVISLSPWVLPLYATYSLLRMTAAYILSLVFTLVYGHIAATNKNAARFMVPILDILQSIPILSFLPSVVLTLVKLFPNSDIGVELSSIILIFTSQAWNMTFSFYHSAKTVPQDLQEAASVYRMARWQKFLKLEVAFGMMGLVWNSMMSWAGGWFFLMVAEQLTLGNTSFQLPGIGSYLQVAANTGNYQLILLGLATLILLIILLDFFLWRPLVAWSDKFKFETTRAGDAPESPILDLLQRSSLLDRFNRSIGQPMSERITRQLDRLFPPDIKQIRDDQHLPQQRITTNNIMGWLAFGVIGIVASIGIIQAALLLSQVHILGWLTIVGEGSVTFLRTMFSIAFALAWTVPVGVKIGMNPKWSHRLQPIVQIISSIPATAVFPVILIFILRLPQGINIAAIILMMLGTQWYVLFNVIAGAMSIPADLREAARNYQVNGWRKWRTLILPAIFPYLVTGMITASGGAWNTSIVAEYVQFNNHTQQTYGLGAAIADAAAKGNLAELLAATLVMAVMVVLINRLLWRRLYALADRKYSLG